jgi:excisionase family DNA binding protein
LAQECDRVIPFSAIACPLYCVEGDRRETMLKQKPSPESVLITEQETEDIKKLQQILGLEPAQVKLVASHGEEILIPESVYNLLGQIVRAMASGQAVSIVTHNRELTTQQAADILNVSRPFLVKLLDEGAIPCIKVGSHRRIQLKDLIIYKEQRKVKRRQGLKELTQFLQEEGFYEAGIHDMTQD